MEIPIELVISTAYIFVISCITVGILKGIGALIRLIKTKKHNDQQENISQNNSFQSHSPVDTNIPDWKLNELETYN